jgi:hypothetical protein
MAKKQVELGSGKIAIFSLTLSWPTTRPDPVGRFHTGGIRVSIDVRKLLQKSPPFVSWPRQGILSCIRRPMPKEWLPRFWLSSVLERCRHPATV